MKFHLNMNIPFFDVFFRSFDQPISDIPPSHIVQEVSGWKFGYEGFRPSSTYINKYPYKYNVKPFTAVLV